MADVPTVSLTKFAREVLADWQKIVDDKSLALNRHGMRTCLNLEIVMQNLISLVEQAEKQAEISETSFDTGYRSAS